MWNRFDDDIREEVRAYVDLLAAEKVRMGMSPEDARRAALIETGGIAQVTEAVRGTSHRAWAEAFAHDIKYAWRSLRRTPAFALIVVLTIALGVGANAAIFSAVNAVILRPLPFPNGDRLVSLWATNPDRSVPRYGVSWGDFRDWRARTRTFDDMAMYGAGLTTLVGQSGPESVGTMNITPNLFDVLGIRPQLGRLFGADDEPGESSNTVVLTDGYWSRRFGRDRQIIGKSVSVNGRSRTVVGVLPPQAELLGAAFLGVPLDVVTVIELTTYPRVELHAQHLFGAIARLKPGTTIAQARRDLSTTEMQLAKEDPMIAGWTASVFYLTDDLSLSARDPLLILLAASALLLVIACTNVANLVLVRGATREREFAVRKALGAPRRRLIQQLVVESFVLAAAGGAVGLLVAGGALRGIRGMIPFGVIARADEMTLNGAVLAFAFALSIVTALAFGLWPALRASSSDVNYALRDGGRGNSGGPASHRARRLLVIAQLAIAVVLLICAALVWQSVRRMLKVDPGFRPEQTITAQITLGTSYPDTTALAFYRSLLTNLESRPGIVAAGATDTPPLTGTGVFTAIRLTGMPPRPPDQPLMSTIRAVTPGYFKAMAMHLQTGHDFEWSEAGNSIVVSNAAANAFWPRQPALDKQIGFKLDTKGMPVIGVVNDTREVNLSTAPAPVVYVSMRRYVRVFHTNTVVVRGTADRGVLVRTLREAVRELDPEVALYNVQTLQQIVDQSTAQTRLNISLLGVFAIAALLLATLGIYGVVSYTADQRRREIGVRVALGAQRADVVRLVLGEGARLATAGVAIGVVVALLATRLIQSWLFEIGRADSRTFAEVALGLALFSLLASYIPAVRAARVDPLIAMRADA